MKQNITLSIEQDLLREAKRFAAERGLSISGLLAEDLRALIEQSHAYEQARNIALALFDRKLALGGQGVADRGKLHER